MAQVYRVGQQVTGSVQKLLPYGLFVRLTDGTRAYVRRRELGWDSSIDPRTVWRVGQLIDGTIIKLPKTESQHLELSHRTTLPDPWDEYAARLNVGDIIPGTIQNIVSYGVYVEIVPGVNGFISLAELSTQPITQAEEIVWLGDNVEAMVTYINVENQKLTLSIRARLRQLSTVASIMSRLTEPETAPQGDEGSSPDTANATASEQPDKPPAMLPDDPALRAKLTPILIIDDYVQLRNPLTTWLQEQGFDTDQAPDGETALKMLNFIKKLAGAVNCWRL